MYILEKEKVAYIAHPKTASSSMAHVLINELGFTFAGRSWRDGVTSHHAILDPPEGWEGWSVMSTIRDPLDTIVSWYFHHVKHMKQPTAFPMWLRSWLQQPNPLVKDRLFFGLKYTTHVLIYEHLQCHFDNTLADLGLPAAELPWKNVGNVDHIPYQKFYERVDSQLMSRVLTRYEQDIQDYAALASL